VERENIVPDPQIMTNPLLQEPYAGRTPTPALKNAAEQLVTAGTQTGQADQASAQDSMKDFAVLKGQVEAAITRRTGAAVDENLSRAVETNLQFAINNLYPVADPGVQDAVAGFCIALVNNGLAPRNLLDFYKPQIPTKELDEIARKLLVAGTSAGSATEEERDAFNQSFGTLAGAVNGQITGIMPETMGPTQNALGEVEAVFRFAIDGYYRVDNTAVQEQLAYFCFALVNKGFQGKATGGTVVGEHSGATMGHFEGRIGNRTR